MMIEPVSWRPRAMRVLVRADAGPRIGAGHVMRCLAVVEALQDLMGSACGSAGVGAPGPVVGRLIAAELPDRLIGRLTGAGLALTHIATVPGSDVDLARTRACLDGAEESPDPPWPRISGERPESWERPVLILDGYSFAAGYRQEVRRPAFGRPAPYVVVFDDLAIEPALHADLVINPAPGAERLPYPRIAPGAVHLLGPRFAPLRREFRIARQRAAAVPPGGPDAVLISFGGSDPLGLTGPVTQALAGMLPSTVRLIAVAGAGYPEPDGLRRALAPLGPRVTLEVDCQTMAERMTEAGLAIAAAGGTAGELAALGIPAVLVIVADNQAAAGAAPGPVIDARGQPVAVTAEQIAGQAAALWADPGARGAIAARLAGLVDTQGALRIAAAVLAGLAPSARSC